MGRRGPPASKRSTYSAPVNLIQTPLTPLFPPEIPHDPTHQLGQSIHLSSLMQTVFIAGYRAVIWAPAGCCSGRVSRRAAVVAGRAVPCSVRSRASKTAAIPPLPTVRQLVVERTGPVWDSGQGAVQEQLQSVADPGTGRGSRRPDCARCTGRFMRYRFLALEIDVGTCLAISHQYAVLYSNTIPSIYV